MAVRGGILLTGATGQLGRYLLRDLLAAGHRVAVLARPDRKESPDERVRALHAFACETVRPRLPRPTTICGDLRATGLGLGRADRAWLARRCSAAVHAGACVAFRDAPDGEPRVTNTDGTRRLLEACGELGLGHFHYVSTAFVCGERAGPVLEGDPTEGATFHNAYESSKHAAEYLVRTWRHGQATVYRPSIIVGDSRTGFTSTYHGPYRFLELADRMAQSDGTLGKRSLPLRLPFDGTECRNLVPVDWVSRAIALIVGRPAAHGRTYHLTATRPTSAHDIAQVAVDVLGLEGVQLVGPMPLERPSELERAFLDGLREYWPYFGSDPEFDCRNTLTAVPELPVPGVDRAALARTIRFAVSDRWGRRSRATSPAGIDCADYIERFFPESIPRSALARLHVEATLGFEIRGASGGHWVCRLGGGRVLGVERGAGTRAEIEYRMDGPTFTAVVSGRETPQVAFFGRRIQIAGNIEKALKLAILFRDFVREFPYRPAGTPERHHAVA